MVLIIIGLLMWTGAHLMPRLAPGLRRQMGAAGKGVIASFVLGGLVLMVMGYRGAESDIIWARISALVGINNLLMLMAVYLFIGGLMQAAPARWMRHPMLIGVKTWALAHVLVNGDVPSFVLFGGLMAWAVVAVILINRAERDWTRPEPVGRNREIAAIVVSLGMFGAFAAVHYWAGYPAFG